MKNMLAGFKAKVCATTMFFASLLFALVIPCVSIAQIVGGDRANTNSGPMEVKPSELSKGGFSDDVSLFTGAYNTSYDLGTVKTPAGLSYNLKLNYSSVFTTGDNVPVSSGIPYGEGWSIAVPTISVMAESYFNYTKSQENAFRSDVNNYGNTVPFFLNQDPNSPDVAKLNAEGSIMWYAPKISIPGIISERFVFKYHDPIKGSVFVPYNFETYVEAYYNSTCNNGDCSDGSWTVHLTDGTEYTFGTNMTTTRNASNQRYSNDPNHSDNHSVNSSVIGPRKKITTWYCTIISNNNSAPNQGIKFLYKKFGAFNQYKEFLQGNGFNVALTNGAPGLGGSIASTHDYTEYRDILLTEVQAFAGAPLTEKIVLDYRTIMRAASDLSSSFTTNRITGDFPSNMLIVGGAGVSRYDSLYNSKTVYSRGVTSSVLINEQSIIGSPYATSPKSFDFEGGSMWHRYYHVKSPAKTNPIESILKTNPYLACDASGTCTPYYKRVAFTNPTPPTDLSFSHGFLESPQIFVDDNGSRFVAGDTYEVKTLLNNQLGTTNRFCNVDINIVGGDKLFNNSEDENWDQISQLDYQGTRGLTIFSTFNQAIKWNTLTGGVNPTPNGADGYTVTSNLFTMPNLPVEYSGFRIQVGPANSDNDFDSQGILDYSSQPYDYLNFSGPETVNSSKTYFNRRLTTSVASEVGLPLKSTDPIPQNFGIGMPWQMVYGIYSSHDFLSYTFVPYAFNFWWNHSTANFLSPATWSNVPTLADDNMKLNALELVRYSKNPYMLYSVKHYIYNNEQVVYSTKTSPPITTAPTLVSQLDFSYKIVSSTILNNSVGLDPAVFQNSKMPRYIFLLKNIRQVPVNPSESNFPAPIFDYSKIPMTHFEYTAYQNDQKGQVGLNSDIVALTKVTDQLGGVTAIDYYDLNYQTDHPDQSLSHSRYLVTTPASGPDINFLALRIGNPRALEIILSVKSKRLESENIFPKQWNYEYSQKLNPRVNTPSLNDPANGNDHFRSYFIDRDFGFGQVKVIEPELQGNLARNYTIYNHFGGSSSNTFENYLLFGKLSKAETFDGTGFKIKSTVIDYAESVAYVNGMLRTGNIATGSFTAIRKTPPVSYDNDYDNRSNYQNSLGLDGGDNSPRDFRYSLNSGINFNGYAYSNSASISYFLQDQLEIDGPTIFKEYYLHSWFVRKTKESTTTYEKIVSKNLYNILSGSLSNGNVSVFQSASYTPGSNIANSSITPIPIGITKITEYNWWDASFRGNTSSPGYKVLLKNFTDDSLDLNFEPSWQLYSTKTYSPQHPDAYQQEEYFHFYDLKNDYQFGLTVKNQFDELYHTYHNGLRSLLYQKRTTFKAINTAPRSSSTYYNYAAVWTPTPDEQGENSTVSFTGSSCSTVKPEPCIPVAPGDHGAPDGYNSIPVCIGNSYYWCPTLANIASTGDCPPSVQAENCHPGATQMLNLGLLLYKSTVVDLNTEISATNANYLSLNNLTPSPILRFSGPFTRNDNFLPQLLCDANNNIYFGGITDQYFKPVYPFDNLITNEVIRRTNLNQVKEERNEKGLRTRYYYTKPLAISHQNTLCTEDVYVTSQYKNVGLPVAITVGYDNNDSLRTEFVYNMDNSIQKITDPNGKIIEYEYDDFGRLKLQKENSRKLSSIQYHQWENDQAQTFTARAAQNFVETYTFNETGSNVALHSRAYVDPLGRKYCNLAQISPDATTNALANEMVYSGETVYDNWNRPVINYKPFQRTGSFAIDYTPFFNTTESGATKLHADQVFENSLNSRLLRSSKYGQNITTGVAVSNAYSFITGTALGSELSLSNAEKSLLMSDQNGNSFANYTFIKTVTTDEDNKIIAEYKNAMGQRIATRQMLGSSTNVVTLFIYDSRGNITQVINPEKQITNYKYNLRGNLYEKQTVDGGISRYLYNESGQVVLEQDANALDGVDDASANTYFRFYSYDLFGRITNQSRVHYGSSFTAFNGLYRDATSANNLYQFTFSELMTYSWLFNVGNGAGLLNIINDHQREKQWFYHSKPAVSSNPDFPNLHTQAVSNINSDMTNLKGRVAASISYNHTNAPIQYCLYSYDNEGRLKWDIKQFNKAGISVGSQDMVNKINYPIYNLQGSLKTEQVDMGADGTVEMAYDYQYDGWNRLSVVSANGQALASYQYNDALGLITVERHLGETVGACPQATVSTHQYSYDDRDRLTSITGDLFDEYLYYDSQHPQAATDNFIVSASKNYNGNINALKAVYKFNNTTNASTLNMAFSQPTIYGYKYDRLNRLTSADASVMENLVSAGPATPARLYGDENFTYDRIGNIKKLNRYLYNSPASVTAGATNDADIWTYGYTTGTNKLSRIDQIGDVLSALIGQYTYDQNGNVRTDTKRSVNQTTYGRANLPVSMTIDNKTATYFYGVDDSRLYKKRLNNTNNTVEDEAYYLKDAAGRDVAILNLLNSTTDYYVYGKQRVAKLQGGSTQYYTTDHLGNTRVTYTATANCVPPLNNNPPILTVQQTVLNVNDYFPYGKILRSYVSSSDEKFEFIGKERDVETGLDFMTYRFYDGDVARFLQKDPLADKFPNNSPFDYAQNRPINGIDIDGLGYFPIISFPQFDISTFIYSKINSIATARGLGSNSQTVIGTNFIDAIFSRYTDLYAQKYIYEFKFSTVKEGSASDAFRHAFWSALMTINSNSDFATQMGDAHEKDSKNSSTMRNMDFFNNSVGRIIGSLKGEYDHKKLSLLILDKIKNGELIMVNKDNDGNELFEKSHLDDKEYEDVKNAINEYDFNKAKDEVENNDEKENN
ncbi:MAG: RHS repeat-associated core domain-containing protein [Bacteroidetes bacterium]|nr:RHS repeat-associated core domain-containing protein [Bacteroidota bacterium]